MTEYRDFSHLIENLDHAPPNRGIVLVDTRYRESFHSYRQILRRTRSHAGHFDSSGVRKGHRVLVSLSAGLDSICSFLGLIVLGAVPVSVPSPVLTQDREAYRRRIADLLALHRIERILMFDELQGIAGRHPGVPLEAELPLPATESGPSVFRCSPTTASVAPDDVAFVQFSSGSTSHPKGVPITHRNLLYNLDLIVKQDLRTDDSVWVSWLPLCHDMGLVGGLLTNLVLRNQLVLMHPLSFMTRPVRWLEQISRHRGTVTAVPNFALDVCTDRISDPQLEAHRVDLDSLRWIYCGSEPVRVSSVRRFEDRFGPYGFAPGGVYPVYGMSETTLIVSAPDRTDSVVSERVEGIEVPSVGYPLGDFELRILGNDGDSLAAGSVGEIWVRGTSVTPGYLPLPGRTEAALQDGWLATGDLGFLDPAGRLYITGRIKDLIIHQGRNYYAHDIAECVETVPFVRRGKVHVFGFDIDGEERIVVMTAPPARGYRSDEPPPGSESAATIRDPDAESLKPFKNEIRKTVLREFGLPVHDVHLLQRIPKTTSGKIDRRRCAEIYRQSLESVPAAETGT